MRLPIVAFVASLAAAVVLPGAFAGPAARGGGAHTTVARPGSSGAILVATPRRGERIVLRNRPAGRALAVVRRRTEFGSKVKLGVAFTRGNWVAVISERLPNGTIGWVPRKRLTLLRIDWSVHVSLSRHVAEVRRNGRLVTWFRVATGAPSSPTPRGRYVITDHVDARKYGGAYGCCLLVLSGHQTHPPATYDPRIDWRLAFHGGSGIGTAVSAGCLHARDSDLQLLMRLTPLGTPVVVTA
jgi:hypothetical protein